MHIRPFKERDFPAILDIYLKSKLDELRFENGDFELLPLEKDKHRLSALRESEIYVYDDGAILGYGALCGTEIRALYVLPQNRTTGIGKILLEFLLTKSPGPASLMVASTNYPAINLYEGYGFEVIAEIETTYNGARVFANKMVCSENPL